MQGLKLAIYSGGAALFLRPTDVALRSGTEEPGTRYENDVTTKMLVRWSAERGYRMIGLPHPFPSAFHDLESCPAEQD